jgi:hypothetical protein
MKYGLRTIGYFVNYGLFYGFMLGAWSGTAILPLIGTIYAGFWGTGIGIACGLLCGLFVGVGQAYTFHADVDLGRFRRRLTLGVGILVPIAAALLLVITSRGLIWGPGGNYGYLLSPSANVNVLVLSLIAVMGWGGLSAASAASDYPEWLAGLKTDQISGIVHWPSRHYPIPRLMGMLVGRWMNWGTLILGAVGGMLYQLLSSAPFVRSYSIPASAVVSGAVAGAIGSLFVALLISFGNAALLTFLKKTVFAEDVLPVSPHKLRWILTIIALIFTGITSAWTLIFAPLCALLMALYVYDSFPLFDEDVDKAKRKEKNALVLEDKDEEENIIDETEEQSGRLMQRA